jgi:cytochrome c oxidase subunit I+III
MSLIFGYAFLATVAPGWPPPRLMAPSVVAILVALAGLALAFAAGRWALAALRSGRTAAAARNAAVAAASTAAALVGILALGWRGGLAPGTHAYDAVTTVLLAYSVVHLVVAGLMLAFVATRLAGGWGSAARTLELRVAALWSGYAAFATVMVIIAVAGPGATSWRW